MIILDRLNLLILVRLTGPAGCFYQTSVFRLLGWTLVLRGAAEPSPASCGFLSVVGGGMRPCTCRAHWRYKRRLPVGCSRICLRPLPRHHHHHRVRRRFRIATIHRDPDPERCGVSQTQVELGFRAAAANRRKSGRLVYGFSVFESE